MSDNYDLLVIGAGPGGYAAAIRAAQLGLRTAVVEREHLGGVCLNWGCIPTKALLYSATAYRQLRHASELGLTVGETGFNIDAMVARSRAVSDRLSSGVRGLLAANRIDVIWGDARLGEPGEVLVSPLQPGAADITLRARDVIVATGSRPIALPGLEVDEKQVWSHVGALQPAAAPRSLLVVGAGAIGIEFAYFYAALGTQVTVLELQPHILPAVDEEIAALAQRALEKQGIRIVTGARVAGASKQADAVTVTWELEGRAADMTVERVICAVGVNANAEGLGLERRGVALHRGGIQVDGFGRTNVPGVHAVGDVAGAPMLAHKAAHEGIICAEKIAGLDPQPVERDMVPACIYCAPQIAGVGLSERQAVQAGWDVKVGRFPLSANGKALAMGEHEGLVKTVFDRATGRLLGAHLVGPEVTELIHGYVVAMNLETTEEDLMHVIYPHPTLSETMHESTLAAYGRAIHLPPPAARGAASSSRAMKADAHESPPQAAEASR